MKTELSRVFYQKYKLRVGEIPQWIIIETTVNNIKHYLLRDVSIETVFFSFDQIAN